METFSKRGVRRLRVITEICNKILEKGEKCVFYDVSPHCASINIRIYNGAWEIDKEPCNGFYLYLSGDLYNSYKYKSAVEKLEKYLTEE